MPGHIVERDVDGDFAVTWLDRSGRPFIEVFHSELAVAESFFQSGEDVSFKLCRHGCSSLGVIVSDLALHGEEGQERERATAEFAVAVPGRVGEVQLSENIGKLTRGTEDESYISQVVGSTRSCRRLPACARNKATAVSAGAAPGRMVGEESEASARGLPALRARGPDLRLAVRPGGASASGAQPRRCGRKIEA